MHLEREFPGNPVVKTWHFCYYGPGSIPSQGIKILQAMKSIKKTEERQKEVMWRLDAHLDMF